MPSAIVALGAAPAGGHGRAGLGRHRAEAARGLPARGGRGGGPAHPRRRLDRGGAPEAGVLAATRVADLTGADQEAGRAVVTSPVLAWCVGGVMAIYDPWRDKIAEPMARDHFVQVYRDERVLIEAV